MNCTTNKLNEYAYLFLKTNFNLELNIPIEINNRLTSTGGYYQTRNDKPYKISISGNLIKHHDHKDILDVLSHELIHYALHVKRLPYKDNDYAFIEVCNLLGVSLTNVISSNTVYLYQCDCKTHRLNKRIHTNKYCCSLCNSKLAYKGTDRKR